MRYRTYNPYLSCIGGLCGYEQWQVQSGPKPNLGRYRLHGLGQAETQATSAPASKPAPKPITSDTVRTNTIAIGDYLSEKMVDISKIPANVQTAVNDWFAKQTITGEKDVNYLMGLFLRPDGDVRKTIENVEQLEKWKKLFVETDLDPELMEAAIYNFMVLNCKMGSATKIGPWCEKEQWKIALTKESDSNLMTYLGIGGLVLGTVGIIWWATKGEGIQIDKKARKTNPKKIRKTNPASDLSRYKIPR